MDREPVKYPSKLGSTIERHVTVHLTYCVTDEHGLRFVDLDSGEVGRPGSVSYPRRPLAEREGLSLKAPVRSADPSLLCRTFEPYISRVIINTALLSSAEACSNPISLKSPQSFIP